MKGLVPWKTEKMNEGKSLKRKSETSVTYFHDSDSFERIRYSQFKICRDFVNYRLSEKKAAIAFSYEDSTPADVEDEDDNEDSDEDESDDEILDIDLGNSW